MKRTTLIAAAVILATATFAEIKVTEFSVSAPTKKATGYKTVRWRAAITNTGAKPETGHVWLGGIDKDGFAEERLSAHHIKINPGQTIRFTEQATLTNDEAALFKKWTVMWHSLK